MPAIGGPGTRLTSQGTGEAVWESVDGSRLFYAIGEALWSAPAAGGAPRQVLTCVKGGAIAVGASGIYYASCNFMFELNTALHVVDPDTQHDRTLGTLTDYGSIWRSHPTKRRSCTRRRPTVDSIKVSVSVPT